MSIKKGTTRSEERSGGGGGPAGQTITEHSRVKRAVKKEKRIRQVKEGKEYVAVREVAQKDAHGNVVFVEKPKRIKHWFYTNNGKNWFLEVRYGNRALELAEGKTAIAIQSKEKIVGTIEKVIEAVIGKELDTAITKAVSKRNANKQSKN